MTQWKLVPVEATEEIQAALFRFSKFGGGGKFMWQSALAAAPCPSEELVERMAKAMCKFRGIDPDESQPEELQSGEGPWPMWVLFRDEVRAALAALEAK